MQLEAHDHWKQDAEHKYDKEAWRIVSVKKSHRNSEGATE